MRSGPSSIKKGFTLVELLLALMVSALVLNSAFLLAFGTLHTQKRTAVFSKNYQEAAALLGLMTKEIRAANAISPSSTGSKLVLVSGPDLITYEFLSQKIKRSKNLSGQYMTGDGTLKKTAFSYPAPGIVRIEACSADTNYVFTSEALCRNTE